LWIVVANASHTSSSSPNCAEQHHGGSEMRVCIHRWAKQIGGTCIEIEAGGQRIALDVGLPLDAAEDTVSLLPAVLGFRDWNASLLAVVISHPHQDHDGLARHLRPDLTTTASRPPRSS
jgi:mRNA degradation ribonuclease J1/J2